MFNTIIITSSKKHMLLNDADKSFIAFRRFFEIKLVGKLIVKFTHYNYIVNRLKKI